MASIDSALAALALQDTVNYTQTANEFGVNRSTLSRRHRCITGSKEEGRQSRALLSLQEEKGLLEYINKLTVEGIPPTNAMVRNLAVEISGKQPGKNWSFEFVERHKDKLQSKYLKGADLERKKADNAYQFQAYFDLVRGLIGVDVYTKKWLGTTKN